MNSNLAAEWQLSTPTHAECRRDEYSGVESRRRRRHEAPHGTCRCGLYAYHDAESIDPDPLLSFSRGDSVYGAVLGWGRLEVHPTGWRAEWAQPVVLAYSERQSYRHVLGLQAMAAEHEIPIVELSELAEVASAHGKPVPDEHIPSFKAGPLAEITVNLGAMMLPAKEFERMIASLAATGFSVQRTGQVAKKARRI